MDDDDEGTAKGFTIECQGGERVDVSDMEAKCIFHLAEYFRNVFKHGTREKYDRLLRKPDWSLATANHVVAYLTGKRVEIPYGEVRSIIDFAEAFQQILLAALVYYPQPRQLSDIHVSVQLRKRVFFILNHEKSTRFVIKMRLCGIIWDAIVHSGILLLPFEASNHGPALTFGIPNRSLRDGSFSYAELKRLKNTMVHTEVCQALTPFPLPNAIGRVTKTVHQISRKIAEAKRRLRGTEAMSIMIPIEFKPTIHKPTGVNPDKSKQDASRELNFAAEMFDNSCFDVLEVGPRVAFESSSGNNQIEEAVQRVSDSTGAHGIMHRPRNSSTRGSVYRPKRSSRKELPIFRGTFSQLKQCLDSFIDELSVDGIEAFIPKTGMISLRVTAPTTDNLESLIDALRTVDDREVEVDFYHNSYNVKKNVEEMKQLLTLASDPQARSDSTDASMPAFTLTEKDRHRPF